MKKRITKIWGIGLVVVLLTSLLVVALPASAGTLSFTEKTGADIPSTTGKKLITAGYDILDLAVAGDAETMYAVTDNGTDGIFYKSTNGGSTWSTVDVSAGSAGSLTRISHVAVAPDDADIIAVAGDTTEVYLSTNGGSTFSLLNNASNQITDGSDVLATINDLAISGLDGSKRYIAVAGTDATDGCLFYFDYGSAAPVWNNAGGAKFTGEVTVTAYYAVAFSPNFPSDLTMVAVSANTGTGLALGAGLVRYHIASFNQSKWDSLVFDSYPKTIETNTVAGPYVVNAADISLDPEYLAGDDTTRIAFVGVAATDNGTETGGIYRLKDVVLEELKAATAINSVAWDGTNLVAGAYDSNNVYRCADALASSGYTVSTSKSYKEIGVTVPPTR